ncbi:hypothetical protein CgunFtcFv8_006882 [Champsocephalus gunnari]|uniref:Meiosis-specific protein MEI4 n=1 Tax=Champsocephalus gunnari TaxID=52237 RepID=A0AAN8CFW3_CHAGU|nr:hypothetical protein CgunFtcFv8_006882 [Champsocephalus gunnari]
MHNDGDNSTIASGDEGLLNLLQTLTVSLAVGIIKTKPPGVSGRDFAEALYGKLRREDENWKEKCEELRQEVLRLRQEVLINTLTGQEVLRLRQEVLINTLTGQEVLINTLTGNAPAAPAVPAHVLDHAYCSGPDEGSETPELLLPVPQSASPLPSLLLLLPPSPSRPPSVPRGETHLPQVRFLQALLSLQRANGPLCFGADGGALLVDSVCCLLVSVVRLCRDAPPPGPGESVLQACHVSASSMEMFCSHRLPDADFRRRVEAALRDLTEMLLHSKGIHRVQSSEKLMQYLITLGKSRMSKSFLLRQLLSQISALADRLWLSFEGKHVVFGVVRPKAEQQEGTSTARGRSGGQEEMHF